MQCAICGGEPATVTRKPLNGLPKGVVACDDCRQAVRDRQVGVVIEPDGSLYITDSRHQPDTEGGSVMHYIPAVFIPAASSRIPAISRGITQADACLIIGKPTLRTRLAKSVCMATYKPYLWVGDLCVLDAERKLASIDWVREWLSKCQFSRLPRVLVVANLESENPGIQVEMSEFLSAVLA